MLSSRILCFEASVSIYPPYRDTASEVWQPHAVPAEARAANFNFDWIGAKLQGQRFCLSLTPYLTIIEPHRQPTEIIHIRTCNHRDQSVVWLGVC